MERLAWIEILDRHGDVSVRHPVYAWPLRVGRAYSSDVVLDDPYVAANHLEIYPAGEGVYQLNAPSSVNAITIGNRHARQTDASVSANQVVRIGQTQLRVRPIDFAVPPEKSLPHNTWSRSWSGLSVAATVLLLTYVLLLWLNYDRAEGYRILLLPIIGGIFILLPWAAFWALIGRVTTGHANFVAHAVNATIGVNVLIFVTLLYGYVDFALNARLASSVLSDVIEALVIGTMLYRHLGLVSRISRRKLGIIVVALTASLYGFGYVTEKFTADDNLANMLYPRTIGPAFMFLGDEKSIDEFIADGADLKAKVDE